MPPAQHWTQVHTSLLVSPKPQQRADVFLLNGPRRRSTGLCFLMPVQFLGELETIIIVARLILVQGSCFFTLMSHYSLHILF